MLQPSILAFGDNVVDCYAEQNLMYPGGNSLNVAVFARRFGATTSYIGAVADDAAGRLIQRALVQEGVGTSDMRIERGRTAFCVIETRNGEREFACADLGVSIIAPRAEDFQRMSRSDAVHTGRSSHVDQWLPKMAKASRVSFDMATVRDASRISKVAPYAFLLSFSGSELPYGAALSLAESAAGQGATWVLVTRGAAGAILLGPGGVTETQAEAIRPVDTLGAGDTSIARALVGLLRGEPADAVLHAASAASAETCMHHGAFGHAAPIEIDRSEAMTLDEIYRTTRPAAALDG